MGDLKRDDEAKGVWRESSLLDDRPNMDAPRFDEREEATARPVVPLNRTHKAVTNGAAEGFSLRAISRHLILAWAVVATLAVGAVALYRSAHTATPQVEAQPVLESAVSGAVTATPQPARREVSIAPVRARKMTETRASSLPSWEEPDWSDREDVKRDEPDEEEEELEERARKEEKRRRKEEKRRREQADDDAERALKQARKQAERLRERMKGKGDKAKLIEVISGGSGM